MPEDADSEVMSIRECLIFAQVVHEVGASNWTQVSNLLEKHPLVTRTKNFYSPSSCEVIYKDMMKGLDPQYTDSLPPEVEKPKAKPNLKLARKFYHQRVNELLALLGANEQEFKRTMQEMDDINAGLMDAQVTAEFGSPSPAPPDNTQPFAMPADPAGPQTSGAPETLANDMADVEMDPAVDESFDEPVAPVSAADQRASKTQQDEDEDMVVDEEVPVAAQSSSPPDITGAPAREDTAAPDFHEAGSQPRPPEMNDEAPEPEIVERQSKEEKVQKASSPSPPAPAANDDEVDETPEAEVTTSPSPPPAAESPMTTTASPEASKQGARSPSRAASEVATEPEAEVGESDTEEREARARPSTRRTSKRKQSEPQPERKRRKISPSPQVEEDTGTAGRTTRRSRASAAATPSMLASSTRGSKPYNKALEVLHETVSTLKGYGLFADAVKDRQAEGYSKVVHRPQDLKSIKLQIRNGQISTTDEYERAIYLMYANAILYNLPRSPAADEAKEMMKSFEKTMMGHRNMEYQQSSK